MDSDSFTGQQYLLDDSIDFGSTNPMNGDQSAVQRYAIGNFTIHSTKSVAFGSTYSVDSNLSAGQDYPKFEQLGPDLRLESQGI